MPTYCYKCKKCRTVTEEVSTIAERKQGVACKKCGALALRDVLSEHTGRMPRPGIWPMVSDAMAVAPSQIPEMLRESKARGVPTEYTKDGQPILRYREHRSEYMKSFGYHDRDGGYGD